MKYASPLIIITIWLVPGCTKAPPPANPANVKVQAQKSDPLKASLDLLRQATEVAHYRAALNQLNAHLSKETGKQTTLTADEQTTLRKAYRLDDHEMVEVESGLFRPADA